MARPRDIPDLDPAAVTQMLGPMALPFMTTYTMMAGFAMMSQLWVDVVFEPHKLAAEGHDLPVPNPLDEAQANVDLFA